MNVNYTNDVQIAFEVQGSVHQRAVLLEPSDWTEERIVEGLASGDLVTTTWHDGGNTEAYVEELSTGRRIALIVSQEIEGEYFDFR